MPGHGSLPCADGDLSAMPGIHVLAAPQQERRGGPGRRPSHDENGTFARVLTRGSYDWFHTAALRRRNHPRDAGISRGTIATTQAIDAGGDDPRLEPGAYRRFGGEYRPARDPAGAARERGVDAMDRQCLPVAARRAGAGRGLGCRSLRPPADFSSGHRDIHLSLDRLRTLT